MSLHSLFDTIKRSGLPMRLRLFIFLILFLSAIMFGVLVILLSTGVFKAGVSEHRSVLDGELAHIAGDVYKSFGSISVQAVDMAEQLSAGIERNLNEHGSSVAQLQDNPELLEHLLEEELSRITSALEVSRGSGVFVLLDATVNPLLPNAEASRSCLYLKNMEPNIVSGMAANLRLAMCPMSIARNNGIRILPQWQMELDLREMPFMYSAMETAREHTGFKLSRLYNWSYGTTLPQNSERVMICTVPLVALDGTVFGVCGIEVSEMLFKLTFSPGGMSYDRLISILTPLEGDTLELNGALFSGRFTPGFTAPKQSAMKVSAGIGGFYSYRQSGKDSYAGLHQTVSLYPSGSAYASEEWAVVIMMPEEDLNSLISTKNNRLIAALVVLILLTVALASIISSRYIRPVVEGLKLLKEPSPTVKTKIPEIDDLLEFLAAQDEVSGDISPDEPKPTIQQHSALFQEFVSNINTLSAAEKAVFDLYVEGHTAREIAEILCLSINTIKTHNRRIYMKLNVTSRKELMVYVQILQGDGYLV